MGPTQETKFNTSFIPKKPVNSSPAPRTNKGKNLFSSIATFIFILTLLATATVFGFKFSTESAIETQIETLQAARREFDEQTVARATRLNHRINAVKQLLDNHVAPSIIFNILEDITLQTVAFSGLDFETRDSGSISISGTGRAVGFESVVLQSDELGRSDFRDVLFDNVQQSETGQGVTFSVDALLDQNIILYRNNIDQGISSESDNIFETHDESVSSQSEIPNEENNNEIF